MTTDTTILDSRSEEQKKKDSDTEKFKEAVSVIEKTEKEGEAIKVSLSDMFEGLKETKEDKND